MTAMTTAEWVSIAPETKLTRAERESGGRGYAYIVADVIGKKAICVTQRMPLAVGYLKELGLDDCKTSSLYDAHRALLGVVRGAQSVGGRSALCADEHPTTQTE